MGKVEKRHEIIPISWACPVLPLDNFKLTWIGMNMKKCDIQFVTLTLGPPYL